MIACSYVYKRLTTKDKRQKAKDKRSKTKDQNPMPKKGGGAFGTRDGDSKIQFQISIGFAPSTEPCAPCPAP